MEKLQKKISNDVLVPSYLKLVIVAHINPELIGYIMPLGDRFWMRMTEEQKEECFAVFNRLGENEMTSKISSIWHTKDGLGRESRHLASSMAGAIAAHIAHFKMKEDQASEITATDEGQVSKATDGSTVCFKLNCSAVGISHE